MTSIYCLYSTENAEPRYIGKAHDRVSYRFKEHVTAALDKEPGALYDWMRDVWRRGHDIAFYTLQEGVIPKDERMFEQYWIQQFGNLLNVAGTHQPGKDSLVGQQIKAALVARLRAAPG